MKKRALSLIEMLIVMLLIGIIGSVIGFNMRGSAEKGRIFKTENGSRQVYDLLTLELAKTPESVDQILESPYAALKQSGSVSDPKKLLVDGWGKKYVIEYNDDNEDFTVTSPHFIDYLKKQGMKTSSIEEKYPWMNPHLKKIGRKG